MTKKLELINLHIASGPFELKGINLTIQQGDVCALIGRSGSGKSTLIKTMLGLQPKRSGTIRLQDDQKLLTLHEHIGYSPQENALFNNLTLKENMEIFAQLRGKKLVDIQSRARTLLEKFRLYGHEHKRINNLSGGMRKRADLVIALLHDPSVLILDEPFTGLDVSLRSFIWNVLKELSKEGKIIILSTHDLEDLKTHCNTFGLIHNHSFYTTDDILTRIGGDKNRLPEYVKHIFEVGLNI